MIRSFSVENFLSIKDKQTLSFRLTKRDRGDGWSVSSPIGDRISLSLGLFGANASGKTCMIRALAFFLGKVSDDRVESYPLKCVSWFYNQEPTIFDIELEDEKGNLYSYHLVISGADGRTILEELLSCKYHKANTRWRLIYKRTQNEGEEFAQIHKGGRASKEDSIPDDFPTKRIRNDVTLLSVLPVYNVHLPIMKLLRGFTNFEPSLVMAQRNVRDLNRHMLVEFVGNDVLREKMNSYVRKIDLGISSFSIKTCTTSDPQKDASELLALPRKQHSLFGKHKVKTGGGEEIYEVPFRFESEGTQIFFMNVMHCLPILNHGGVVILDEIDSCMHPKIVFFLLDLFNDRKINRGKGQIIFSAHLPEILDTLGKSHIWLVEKENQASEFFPLTDVEGVRSDQRIRGKYLAGTYGGVPRVSLP